MHILNAMPHLRSSLVAAAVVLTTGCSAYVKAVSEEPESATRVPENAVAEPDFNRELLEHKTTKHWGEKLRIEFSAVRVVKDWKSVRRDHKIVGRNRDIVVLGIGTDDHIFESTKIKKGTCYAYYGWAHQGYAGGESYDAAVEMIYTNKLGRFAPGALAIVDCSMLDSAN